MVPKIGRYISHAKPPFGCRTVRVWTKFIGKGFTVLLIPTPPFRLMISNVVGGIEIKRIYEVAVSLGVSRVKCDGTSVCGLGTRMIAEGS